MRLSSAVALALTMATGVTVNWLSALYQPSLVRVLLISVLVFVVVTLYERRVTPDIAASNGIRSRAWIDPVRLSFLSFVFAIVVTWLVERLYYWLDWDYTISPPLRIGDNHRFIWLDELTVGLFLTGLALVAVLKRASPVNIICFIVPAVAGLALTLKIGPIQYVFATVDLIGTFFGWICFSGVLLLVASMRADIVRLCSRLFGGRPSEDNVASDGTGAN
jgi:hypothetical protein